MWTEDRLILLTKRTSGSGVVSLCRDRSLPPKVAA